MGRKPAKKKSSFFKVLLGDFSNHLRIPPKFVKNHIGPSLRKCVLKGPSRQCWNVELEQSVDGLFFHSDGWHKFVSDQLLQVGDFLVFRYDGELKFKVDIYDTTCCEKDVEAATKKRPGVPAFSRVKDEIIDLETRNCDEDADRRRRNNAISAKRPRVEDDMKASSGSIKFKSDFPCHKLTLNANCSQYRLNLPKELAKAQGLMCKEFINIRDQSGTKWPAKLVIHKYKKSSDGLDLATGWRECCKANNVSFGDTVIFEFVEPDVVQLHVFRKGRGRKEGNSPSVVIDAPNIKNKS